MDRTQTAKERLRELNEPLPDRLGRTKTVSEEELVASVQCCANCVYYRRQTGMRQTTSPTGESTVSRWDKSFCKRNPPTVVVERLAQYGNALIGESQTTWPQPKHTDWCGEHQPLPGFEEVMPPKPIQGFRPSEEKDD